VIYNCKHCGLPCVEMDEDDLEALDVADSGLLTDGSGSWHVVHMVCAKREHTERKKAEAAK
jgi:hypothetical protein